MAYYIRVLGTQDPDIHIDEIIHNLTVDGLTAKFEFELAEAPTKWTILNILDQDERCLAQLERNPVRDGALGKEELDEFRHTVKNYQPVSAVQWLETYFDEVKVIYAFQLLNTAFENENFDIITNIQTTLRHKTNGILQADNEGFSNEEGYHILWQFSEDVSGEWSCATINLSGAWNKFIINLGDEKQREEFKAGKVPTYAKAL